MSDERDSPADLRGNECRECGASLLLDGTCLRCAPPVMFQSEWLDYDGWRDIVPLQEHEKVNR